MSTIVRGAELVVPRGSGDRVSDVPARSKDVFVGGVQLEIGLPCDGEIAARMTLRGRPDAGCAEEVAEILTLIEGNVHVDVRACVRLDSVIVATLVRAFQELGMRGHYLEVILPPGDSDAASALRRSGIPPARLRVEEWSAR